MRLRTWAALLVCAAVATTGAERAYAQGRAGSSSPGQIAFNDGMNALNGDDYAAAEQKFNEAIQLDSTLVDAYWRLASIHYLHKQYAKAVELLRRCPDKANLDVKQQLALNLYKTSNPPPAEAVKLLEEVTTARPELFAAQLQLGQHLLKSDPKKAAHALELYFKHRPNEEKTVKMDESVRLVLGTAYIYGKDWDLAVKEFETLQKQKPNDLTTKLMLGSALVGKGDPKACSQAIALLERLLPEGPKQPSIYYNLGTCYLKVNRAADAEREAALYTKAKPTDTKGFVLLGDAHFAQRHFDKALLAYQGARAIDKNAAGVLTKIGLTDVELGNFDAAIAELEQAETTSAGDVEVLCALTRAYGKKGARDKLAMRADKLAAIKDAKAQLCAGQAYFAQGNDEKATAAFQDVLAADANSGLAKSNLVKVLNRRAGVSVEKNDLPRALALLTDASKLVADDLMTNRNLGLTLLLSKRYVEAEQVLQRVLKKLGKPDMIVNRLIARSLLGQGKRAEARAEYEKAAQIALRVRGVDLAGIYAELGPLYVETGSFDQAVTVLEQAVKEGGGTPVTLSAQRNLTLAYVARGMDRLKDPKQTDGALDDFMKASQAPKGTLSAKELTAVTCYEGVAGLKAARFNDAAEAFKRAQATGGCPMKPAYEKLGTSFLLAYAGYRDASTPRGREDAVRVFSSQLGKAQGQTAELLRSLLRSTHELLAYDYFQKSDEKRAEASLKSAMKVPSKADRRELDHNLAIVDLASGRLPQAERALDALAGKPAESYLNLGIIKDKQGDGKAALQMYRRAWDRGVRSPKLKEWIDVKERLYGGAS